VIDSTHNQEVGQIKTIFFFYSIFTNNFPAGEALQAATPNQELRQYFVDNH
jgi:hypothetical protein